MHQSKQPSRSLALGLQNTGYDCEGFATQTLVKDFRSSSLFALVNHCLVKQRQGDWGGGAGGGECSHLSTASLEGYGLAFDDKEAAKAPAFARLTAD